MARHNAGLLKSIVLTAAAVPALAFASGAHAAPSGPTPPAGYNATINQGNVPTTASAYSQDCNADEFGNKPAADDGWLFVASPSNFQKLQAQFNNGANVVNFDGTNTSNAYYTKVGDHVAVITPGGWTLTQAYAQLDGSKDFFTLSHTCAASSTPPQQQNTPPSATTGDHSCDSVTFSLSAGSQDTTFTVTPTNGSGADVPVTAGNSKPYTVALDSAHPGATVTANGSTLASFTRPDSCNESGSSGGGTNNGGGDNNNGGTPGGSTGNTGGTSNGGTGNTGGTSNGGTTEGGGVSGVTGSAGTPGGTTSSVLGEKLTKTPGSAAHTPTGVEATTITSLPMTGFAANRALQIAALCFGLGAVALAVGRRRPTHHYIQVRN